METLGEWKWEHYYESRIDGCTIACTTWGNTVLPTVVPAVIELVERLQAEGYAFDGNPVHVSKTVKKESSVEPGSVSYGVGHVLYFSRGDGQLLVDVRGGGTTLAEAAAAAQATVREIRYQGVPIPGGRGQLNTCREIARRLLAEHGHHLPAVGQIVVGYLTAGGRGGWIAKTAARRFTIDELRQVPETGRYYCSQCGQPAPRNRQRYAWNQQRRGYDRLSGCCGALVQRGK